jgi:predicted nucleic acid-binding protein
VRLVVDSGAALRAAMSRAAAEDLAGHELMAPPLLWSEVHSAVHEAVWRRELHDAGAETVLAAFGRLGIRRRSPSGLYAEAYRVATDLGSAKTYDAEFLALARLEGARVLTTDARLRRGADKTGLVLDPSEL